MNANAVTLSMVRRMDGCRVRERKPSPARMERARSSVSPRAIVSVLAPVPILVSARNRYAIRLIPSCAFSFHYRRSVVAGLVGPQRRDSSVEFCWRANRHCIAIGNLKGAHSIVFAVPTLGGQYLGAGAAVRTNGRQIATPFCAGD